MDQRNAPDVKLLLQAALNNSLSVLAVDTGTSAPRLAQHMLRLIDDPLVIAAHPVESRLLAARRAAARRAR